MLCTILYFIDFNYYEIYGTLLTKETYIKSKKGIKPKHFSRNNTGTDWKKEALFKKRSILQPNNPQILSDNNPPSQIRWKGTWNNRFEYRKIN